MAGEQQSPLQYDYDAFLKQLGARVRFLRKESGLTLRALQIEYDFHPTQIHRIERGEGISIPLLLRVAETFQVSVEYLVTGIGLVAAGDDDTQQASTPPL